MAGVHEPEARAGIRGLIAGAEGRQRFDEDAGHWQRAASLPSTAASSAGGAANGPSRLEDEPATDSTVVTLSEAALTEEVTCHHSAVRSALARVRRRATTVRSSGEEGAVSKPRRLRPAVTHVKASEGDRSLAKRKVWRGGAPAHDAVAQAAARTAVAKRPGCPRCVTRGLAPGLACSAPMIMKASECACR